MASDLPKITVVGSLNMDLVTRTKVVPAAGETRIASTFGTGCGGKGLNQAVASARLSRSRADDPDKGRVKVSMVGAIGQDLYGATLRRELVANDIDDSYLQTYAGSSGVAVIIVEEQTSDNRILVTPGANYEVRLDKVAEVLQNPTERPSAIVLQLEIPIPLVIETIELAKANNVAVVLNPAPAAELPLHIFKGLGHLIMNTDEARVLAGTGGRKETSESESMKSIFQKYHDLGVAYTVVTLGGDGVAYSTGNGGFARISAEKNIQVVDTTAAGDTFVGSYAVSLVQMGATSDSFSIDTAVRRANRAAAKTVQKEGAIASIPWADDL